ncbi:MAG TPA: hypothetical protein VER76_07630 [Pyrinomonadaceae bacterium]|nr:hypothetical protein [Pyrinomonadaceae bacterium]
MKPLLALALLFVITAAAGAQAQTLAGDPPDLQIVKFSWSKERLGWERDPFSGPVESFDQMRVRTRNEKRISDAKAGGSSIEVDRVTREAKADSANMEEIRRQQQAAPPRYGFMYKVSFRNNGAQAIKSLDWDHVFFDPATKTETARHQFTGDEKISPGKQKEFTVFSPRPPSHTVSVQKLDKHERERLGEIIVVMRIQYADGSVWQRR